MSFKIGIMQGRLSKPTDEKIQSFPKNSWENEFYLAKKIGFELIEWIIDEDLKSNPMLNRNAFTKIKNIKDETGVNINSICFDYVMTNSFSSHIKSFKKENLEILNFLIEEACPKNDIKFINLPLLKGESLKNEKVANDYKDLFSSLEKKIIANNLIIVLETDLNPDEFGIFLRDVNNKVIRVNYDTGNSAYLSFDAKEEFLSYGQLISNIHIKDCTPKDYTVELGTGSVDFDNVFQLLKNNNYQQDFILQAARGKDDVQTARDQLNFTKVYVSKYFQ